MPSQLIARCVQAFSGTAAVPFENRSPVVNRCPDGREASLCAYSAYTSWPGCSFRSAVRHRPPSAVGNTHASSVARVLRSSDALSGTVTQSFTPSNVSAEPNFPAVVRTAPAIVPLLPRPEPSVTPGPLVSSNPQAPTGAVPGGRRGVHRESDPDGLRGPGCAGRADGDRPGVVARGQPRDVRRHRQARWARCRWPAPRRARPGRRTP